MAVYPCDAGNHRYAGAQSSLYVTRLLGSRPETRSLRYCRAHLDQMIETVRDYVSLLEEDQQMSLVCEHDDCPSERRTTVFLRFFLAGQNDAVQYAGDLCDRHESELLDLTRWNFGRKVGSNGAN